MHTPRPYFIELIQREAKNEMDILKHFEEIFPLQEEFLGTQKTINKTVPLVSVIIVTYQHAKYIETCLEGVLMQKTTFPIEIVIGEDGSTDGTGDICSSYAKKNPDKIRLFVRNRNLTIIKNGDKNIYMNGKLTLKSCRGKYIAMCEGDDYWLDPLKLQKQVEFMEAHPQVSLCFHNAFVLNEKNAATRLFFENPPQETLDFAETIQTTTPTASVMARSDILATLPEWRLNIWCGDLLFRLWCAHKGNLGYLNEVMSVYRVHAGGMVATASRQENTEKAYKEELFMYEHLDRDTNYQHTVPILAQIKRVQERHRRNRNPAAYYLTHPLQILTRLREYGQAIQKHQSVKYFGNLG